MIVEIPEEIEKTFQLPFGYTYVIKGNPGTGKTTFILNMITKYMDKNKGIYISTRVSPDGLQMQFPRIKELLPTLQLLDASQTFLPPLLESEIENFIKNTLQFNSIEEFIIEFSKRIENIPNPIVVIDSWEGLFTQIKEKGEGSSNNNSISKFENYLIEAVRKLSVKLFLIGESDKKSGWDYLVDCVITLYNSIDDGRTLRVFEINKIRSIACDRPKRLFSLDSQNFVFFSSVVPQTKTISKWNVLKDPEDACSTGSSDFDKILLNNGFMKGSYNLIEYDPEVPIESLKYLITSLVCNFSRSRKGVIIYSLDSQETKIIDRLRILLYLSEDDINERIRIFRNDDGILPEKREYVIPIQFEKYPEKFTEVYVDMSNKTKNLPVLSIMSYNSIDFSLDFGNRLELIINHIKSVKKENLIEIGIINSNRKGLDTFNDQLASLADTHFKIINYFGDICIFGIKPFTPLYHFGVDYTKGNLKVQLTKII